MANIFKPKRSSTASSIPTISDLVDGELAINSADKKIYVRESQNIISLDNAGTLSGLSSSQFLRSDINQTKTGSLTASSLISNNNILLGTSISGSSSTPSYIDLGTNYSNGSTRDKLKIYLYNSGIEQYGFGVGAIGDIQYHSNAYHDFYIGNNAAVRINGSGNLGIGVANPSSYKLQVSGSISLSESGAVAGNRTILSSGSGGFILNHNDNSPIIFQTEGANRFRWDHASSALLINTTTATGTASQPLQVSGGAYVSGNLGVGATNPNYKLQVRDGNTTIIDARVVSGQYGDIRLTSEEGGEMSLAYARNASNYGSQTSAGDFSIKSSSNLHFVIGSDNATTKMYINTSGNVGIGTINPSYKFDVRDGGVGFTDENGGQAMLQIRNYSTPVVGSFTDSYSVEFRHATSGSITHGMLIHTSENQDTRRVLDISDAGGIFATFVNQKVGIGVTNPTQKLDINGALRLRGALYDVNNSAGTSGQVLKSTGTGIEWAAASGGSTAISACCTSNFLSCNTTISFVSASANNFLVGCGAGSSLTTGCENNFFGFYAGRSNTTGSRNNFFGSRAGCNNTTGNNNNFFGANVGCCNTTGGSNNFFGSNAGRFNTTGSCNNFFGEFSGYCNTTGTNNNFFGYTAGCANTTGCNNIFIGCFAGRNNTTGNNNNFFGLGAGLVNTTGGSNNFFGSNAGRFNTTGSCNNFFGEFSGYCNTTQSNSIAIGLNAGYWNQGDNNIYLGECSGRSATRTACTTGSHNIVMGKSAGSNITIGFANNFFGLSSGKSTTSGMINNFFGYYAGSCNTEGSSNNFIGETAGFSNTTGGCNNFLGYAGYWNATGSHNNFFGSCAGHWNATGSYNNFFGRGAGGCNMAGSKNTFIGRSAGYFIINGSCNVFLGDAAGYSANNSYRNNFIGYAAGYSFYGGCYASDNNFFGTYAGSGNFSGCNNVFIGNNSGRFNYNASNNIAIGWRSGSGSGFGCCGEPDGLVNLCSCGNYIVMGNSFHTTACIQIAWTTPSDIRYKCVYGDVPHGRDFLRGVKPIKYSFKDIQTGELKEDKIRYGFSAQEILSLEGENNIIVDDSNPDHLGLTHEYLIPILVNAVKELDAENQELVRRINEIENIVGISSNPN